MDNRAFRGIYTDRDVVRFYTFNDILKEHSFHKVFEQMTIDIDESLVDRMWKSVMLCLPVTFICIGRRLDKEFRILSDIREVVALLRLFGYLKSNMKIYIDPMTCEIGFKKTGDVILLKNVYDTYKLIDEQDYIKSSEDISDEDKRTICTNLDYVNSRMQSFNVCMHCLLTSDEKKEALIKELSKLYRI